MMKYATDSKQWLEMPRGVPTMRPPPPDACEEDLATFYKQVAEQYRNATDYKVRDACMAYMRVTEGMLSEIKNNKETLLASRRADLKRPLLKNDDEPMELSPEDDETNKAKTDEVPVTLSPKDDEEPAKLTPANHGGEPAELDKELNLLPKVAKA